MKEKNLNLIETFWTNVAKLRQERGMTWAELGLKTGHTSTTLLAMKSSLKAPSFAFALELADELGVSVEELSSSNLEVKSVDKGLVGALARATRKLDEENLMVLIRTAEAMDDVRRLRSLPSSDAWRDEVSDVEKRYL